MLQALGALPFLPAVHRARASAAPAPLTLHISPEGDDGNDGLSPRTARRTLTALTDVGAPEGSKILLERGGTWRETLVAPADGVTIAAYGDGPDPVISGADPVTGLAPVGDGSWVAPMAEPTQLFSGDARLERAIAGAPLRIGTWSWAAGTLRVACGEAPPPTLEASVRPFAVDLLGRHGLLLAGLTIQRAASYGIMADTLSDGTIANCRVVAAYVTGISLASAEPRRGLLVEGNRVEDCGASGIGFGGRFDDVVVRANTVARCCALTDGVVPSSSVPAAVFATTGAIKNWGWGEPGWQGAAFVERNTVTDCVPLSFAPNPSEGHGIGIWIDEVVAPRARYAVRHNVVQRCHSRGIYVEKSDFIDVDYNLVVGCASARRSGSIALQANRYGYDVAADRPALIARDCTSNRVRHNTVVGGYWGLEAYCEDPGCRLSDNLVEDNIIVSEDGGGAWLHFAGGGANNGVNGTGNAYHNNCFGPRGGAAWDWDGRTSASYRGIVVISDGAVADIVEGSPRFDDPEGGSYRLTATSPCVDAAMTAPVAVDLDDRPVPVGARADLGAYEFGG